MGLVEVLGELPHFLDLYRTLKKKIHGHNFDAAILIDYPTLNLRLAAHLKRAQIPVYYFISPQIWAWRKGRIKKIRRDVTRMYVVLPFEAEMYQSEGVDAEFWGHPFVDLVKPSKQGAECKRSLGLDPGKKMVALLPGSRMNEIRTLLKVMLGAARKIQKSLPECQFVLPVAGSIDPERIRRQVESELPGLRLVIGRTYDVMACADLAIIASGSATLEAGILGCPMVILYRLNPITYAIAKLLVRAPDIGLINIVAGERVVPELLQGEVTEDNIHAEAMALLQDPARHQALKTRLQAIGKSLGDPGVLARIARSLSGVLDGPTKK